ncbi:MAG: steroid delta-isomerase [Bacteroidetes bacterium]|nr:steroid delta-isomerase [Bacteroidota bacterium]
MRPKELILKWVDAFNEGDPEKLAGLYHENAVNHQVVREPIKGRDTIKNMFEEEFSNANMVCLIETLFEDGEWAILEWRDPEGLRGCGFFHIQNDLIVFQRGYWDQLTFLRQHGMPVPLT